MKNLRALTPSAALLILHFERIGNSEKGRNAGRGKQDVGRARRPFRTGGGLDQEIREPKMYRVILHNDDYTTIILSSRC